MSKTSVFLGLFFIAAAFVACEKEVPFDSAQQLEIDDAIIAKYLVDSSVTATKHSSGLYYNIIRGGTGKVVTEADTVYGNYTMKILKDTVLLSKSLDSTFSFVLPGYMEGWKIGVSLIKEGGEIRMLIPSTLAYQERAINSPAIPPYSILDITLEIVSVNIKPK